jgi:hypothetical protein
MRLTRLAVAGGMMTIMLTATTFAQGPTPNDLRQPASVQRTAFEYDNYLYFAPGDGGNATASDQKAPPAPAQKKPEAAPLAPANDAYLSSNNGNENGNENGNGEDCSERHWGLGIRECNLGKPWTLPQPCFLADRRITVGGWMEAGMYGNQYDADFNGPVGLRPNKFFNLDQLNGYMERIAKQEECEWDWGGRADYMFGVDAPFTQAFGDHSWDFGWNSSSFGGQPLYGSAIPQAYADVTYGDFKLRGGHFYTPIGYEVVPATGNFFYSHSYLHTFAEPFTNTGFLASEKLNEKLTVYGGWVDGWDSGFENRNQASMFLGGLTYKMNECTNIAWYLTWGYNGNGEAFFTQPVVGGPLVPAAAQGDLCMNSFVISHEITSRWSYVFQFDYADNYNLPAGDHLWYGIDQYLFYKVSDCWGFGGRFEWFRDDDGVRVIPGNAGNYFEMASGINWKPHANVMVRPELRYDWYQGVVGQNGNPFNNGNATSQLSGGCDVIFTF